MPQPSAVLFAPSTPAAAWIRIATSTLTTRVFLDSDGDGTRDLSDPCPKDATDDSLVPGVCDSDTLSNGWWCSSAGSARGLALAWLAALLAVGRRRNPSSLASIHTNTASEESP